MDITKKELEITAVPDNLTSVITFIDEQLEAAECPMKTQLQIELAVEEIFINIANYAYAGQPGNTRVSVRISGEPPVAEIAFTDHGVRYDPLEHEDPDITLPASERKIGGLGILITKKTMDDVSYEYRDECNILTMKKRLAQ